MNWIKRIFSKKETTEQCDIHVVVGSSSTKKEQTYMHIEAGTNRPYFTNEPPHIKKWCDKQLQRSKKRCSC
jgi:hypothetical protein|tara:strand:+ start:1001 stop:1213 length:213 start_codon:yes stop_codon:yes gene_type:complete